MGKSELGADSVPSVVETRPDAVATPPKLVRSAKVHNPWTNVDKRSAAGRATIALVDGWMDELGGDRSDVKLTRDLIALAEMYLVAERARSNPLTPAASVAWAENSYWRRAKLLGLSKHHKYSAASRLVRPR